MTITIKPYSGDQQNRKSNKDEYKRKKIKNSSKTQRSFDRHLYRSIKSNHQKSYNFYINKDQIKQVRTAVQSRAKTNKSMQNVDADPLKATKPQTELQCTQSKQKSSSEQDKLFRILGHRQKGRAHQQRTKESKGNL